MEETIELKTNIRMHQTHFKWEIEDWNNLCRRNGGGICSRVFTLKGLGAKIYFTFYSEQEPKLGVFLKHNQLFVRPVVNVHFLKKDNINHTKAPMLEVLAPEEKENMHSYMFSLTRETQKSYIVNNTLTIYCDIKYSEHIHKENNLSDLPLEELITASQKGSMQEKETVFTDESRSSNEDLTKSEYQPHGKYSFHEYLKFFEESKLCNVTFVFKLEEVKAHRAILVMKSPYFRRKLIKENEDYRIDCTVNKNLSPSILLCFLEYLYGIKTFHNLESSIGLMNIYILAKEYEMEKLKIASEFYMTREFV